jgi:hypothetical protein
VAFVTVAFIAMVVVSLVFIMRFVVLGLFSVVMLFVVDVLDCVLFALMPGMGFLRFAVFGFFNVVVPFVRLSLGARSPAKHDEECRCGKRVARGWFRKV